MCCTLIILVSEIKTFFCQVVGNEPKPGANSTHDSVALRLECSVESSTGTVKLVVNAQIYRTTIIAQLNGC